MEAAAGSPCTYQCKLCAQQENAQDLCAHGNAPDACEDCASDARVASVQKLIDALPETVTEENREAAQSALSAVDTAKSALAEAEQEKLTLTRYTALKELLAEPDSPNTGKVITGWEWIEDEELAIIDPETGLAHLPFASPERIAYFEDVAGLLPVAILADGEELTLGDWLCEDYPMESGAYEGEYVFTATLPEGYVLADGTNVLRLTVVLGDPEGEPVAMMGITLEQPTEDYWEDGFHFYKLYKKEHLYWFANEVNNPNKLNSNYLSAVLMNDITVNPGVLDANGNLNSGSFEVWTPIGTSYKSKSYCGKFDGQGHTISGLYIKDSNEGHIGLFGDVDSCSITRLGVVDSYFGGKDAVGGLCGSVTGNAAIKYCYTTATVTGNSNVGTFCGYAADGARIYYCYSAGRVGSDYGAFCGTTARMTNCYALSNTNSIGSNDKVNYKTMAAFKSGEVTYGMTKTEETPGWRQTIGTHDFPQCTTKGDVVYCATVDGTVNYHNHTGDTCTMCDVPTFENGHYTILTKKQLYWFADYVRKGHPDASAWVDKDITVDEDWVPIGSDGSYTGEFQGTRKYITISGIPAGSSLLGPVNQDVTIRNFKIAGGGSLCTDNFGRIESCFAIGGPVVHGKNQGTIKDSGVSNGKLIAGDNSGSIEACTASNNSVLVAGKNISDAVSGCTASNNSVLIAGDNSGKLTDCTASDASKLIGGNNSGDITNCKVESSESSYASESMLIAKDNSGNLTNCTVSTGDALIAGNNNGGTITNCKVTFGNKLIGGDNSGTITGCSVSDSIDVKLVAGANSGTIQKSYAAGSTSASLCESNNSKIINCYATATSGSAKLCGSNSGTIANCFAAGESGTVLCGGSTSGVTNCYYRAGTSANTVGGTTLTTDAPFASGEVAYRLNQGTDTYPGGVWGQNIGASDNPCPVLYEKTVYYHVDANPQYHNHNKYCNICTPMPDYVNNVWQIKNVDDLYWFAQYVIGNITPGDTYTYDAVLVNDITVNHNVLNPDGTLSADTDKFMVWTPIGDTYKGFTGTFNGNHKTISGLYVNTSDKSYIGLFGVLESGATVKDLTIRDSYFGGTSYVGSICGKSSGNVENCTNSGTVSGGSFVGGVLGNSTESSQVSSCGNTGNVSGTGKGVGGVFGSCSGGSVSNCYNTGSITSTSYFVGGVGGYNEATVTACYNTGMVSSSNNNQVGGVIGRNVGDVTACYNTGAISGNNYVGGVCGYVSGGTVNACYSTGTVSGSSDVGGVCGTSSRDSNQTPKISNCYYNNELYSGNGFGSSYNSTVENVSGKTTKEFASGEVAYLLNGSTDNGTWKQNIDKAGASRDETPNFTGAAVYQATSGECTPGYTNNTSLEKNHVFEDHICVFCDKRDQDPITVTGIKANDKTYDGSVEAQLNTTNMKLSNVQDGHTVTVSAAGVFDNANAGTGKTVTITLTLGGADSDNYYLESETITTQADITKKPVTAVVTVTPKTYDGTNTATVNAEVKEGLVSGDSITITGLTGTFDTATAGTGKTVTVNAAGKSITGTGATNYAVTIPDTAPGTITKAQATITVAEGKDAYSKTYGDPAFQLEGITDNSSDADVTYAVTEGTGVVSVSDSGQVTILKAGTATITLSLPESDNYLEATSQTIRIDVAKKVGTVNITGDPSKTYDGQPAALTEEMFSVTEDGGRIPSVAYKEKTAEDSAYTGTAPTNAGDYILRVTLAETDNYAEVMETKEFTISPRSVTVSGITADGKTYDGKTTATLKYDGVTFTGKLGSDSLTVTGTGEFTDANVGENKTVTITNLTLGGASKDNYTLSSTTATATATITKAASSVTTAPADARSLYTGGNVPLIEAGDAEGGTMMYRLGENGPWTELLPQAAAHGEYTVYYYVKGDGNHEDTAQQSLKARILPFEITAQP
ncbi:MAG: hypothetical protein J6J18_11365, partial [Oscillospiraceae bacterium]|nr:hypothetical protein [Oscillospiraceae bacterium]MBP3674414.1 hypothetical protein [Oscillospiraceae bacterium]